MIIACIICAKKFDVSADLIPKKGRLVQCNNCNHKWFFKKEIIIYNFIVLHITNLKFIKQVVMIVMTFVIDLIILSVNLNRL